MVLTVDRIPVLYSEMLEKRSGLPKEKRYKKGDGNFRLLFCYFFYKTTGSYLEAMYLMRSITLQE